MLSGKGQEQFKGSGGGVLKFQPPVGRERGAQGNGSPRLFRGSLTPSSFTQWLKKLT